VYVCVCVGVCVVVCVCLHLCVRACVLPGSRACVCLCVEFKYILSIS